MMLSTHSQAGKSSSPMAGSLALALLVSADLLLLPEHVSEERAHGAVAPDLLPLTHYNLAVINRFLLCPH
jgi:hypothetical protein